MKRLFRLRITTLFLLLAGYVLAQPKITSISPTEGNIGEEITIQGEFFTTPPVQVFFGRVKASLKSRTNSKLEVFVPHGAQYGPISVLVNGLYAESHRFFTPSYENGNPNINRSSFTNSGNSNVLPTFPSGARGPERADLVDMNRDGKLDLIIAHSLGRAVTIQRNTSTNTRISFTQALKIDQSINGLRPIKAKDLNGDGMPDLIMCPQRNNVKILRNTTTLGSATIALAGNQDFSIGNNSNILNKGLGIADLNEDGKPDIVVSTRSSGIKILRNTSIIGGNINFAPSASTLSTTADGTLSIGDVTGDGKPDIVIVNRNTNRVEVYKNTTNGTSIGFLRSSSLGLLAPKFSIYFIKLADLDMDGKLDIVVHSNKNDNRIQIFRNMTTNTGIRFSSGRVYRGNGGGGGFGNIDIGDVNGDMRPDILEVNSGSQTRIGIYLNKSLPGSLRLNAITTYNLPFFRGQPIANHGFLADLNGDKKNDIIAIRRRRNEFYILTNNVLSTAPTLKLDLVDNNNLSPKGETKVRFTLQGIFYYDNNMTVEISKSDGTFPTTPTIIGRANNQESSGAIDITIPSDIPTGEYFIRIKSSNPVKISTSLKISVQRTLYSQSGGDFTVKTLWNTKRDGTGANAIDSDFTDGKTDFVIRGHNLNLNETPIKIRNLTIENQSNIIYTPMMSLGNLSVNGDLTISGGAKLDLQKTNLNLLGQWYNNHGLQGFSHTRGGNITFSANLVPQSIQGETNFTSLTINSTNALTIKDNVRISRTLNLQKAALTIDENKILTFESNAQVLGAFHNTKMIIVPESASVVKEFQSIGQFFFPIGTKQGNALDYSPARITLSNQTTIGTNSSVSITPIAQKAPNTIPNFNAITRHWKVKTNNISSIHGSVSTTYNQNDIQGVESKYVPAYRTNGTWTIGKSNQVNIRTSIAKTNFTNATTIDGIFTVGEPEAFLKSPTIDNFDPITVTYGDGERTLEAKSNNSSVPITYELVNVPKNNGTKIDGNKLIFGNAGVMNIKASQPLSPTHLAGSTTVGLTIQKAKLTAKADDVTWQIGTPFPTFPISYTGFKHSDDESVIDRQPTASIPGNIDRTKKGTYNIIVSGGSDNNYGFERIHGIFTITEKAVPALSFEDETFTYGDPVVTLRATSTSKGNISYKLESQTDNTSLSGNLLTLGNVGEVKIKATLAETPTHSEVSKTATFTIVEKPITITANAITKVEGQNDPPLTYTVKPNLINGDKITGKLEREKGEKVGKYKINKGTLTAGPNYKEAYKTALFTITAKPSIAIYVKDNTGTPVVSGQDVSIGSTIQFTDISKTFTIENKSKTTKLDIESITPDNKAFEVVKSPSSIAPASTGDFTIRLNADNTGTYRSNVSVQTNQTNFAFKVSGEVKTTAPPDIIVYNAVTPNNDGVQDYFMIKNIRFYPNNKVIIFNRWGDIVYEQTGYDNKTKVFTGVSNKSAGYILDTGNYYYAIDKGDGSSQKTGFLYLKKEN